MCKNVPRTHKVQCADHVPSKEKGTLRVSYSVRSTRLSTELSSVVPIALFELKEGAVGKQRCSLSSAVGIVAWEQAHTVVRAPADCGQQPGAH